jgi:hypothetical protein
MKQPGGLPEVSRGLSASDTPGSPSQVKMHARGMPEGSRRSQRCGDLRYAASYSPHPGGVPEPLLVPHTLASLRDADRFPRHHRRSRRSADLRSAAPYSPHPGGVPEQLLVPDALASLRDANHFPLPYRRSPRCFDLRLPSGNPPGCVADARKRGSSQRVSLQETPAS